MKPSARFLAVAALAALASSGAGRPLAARDAAALVPAPELVTLLEDPPPPPAPRPPVAWAEALPALRFRNANTGRSGVFRLYAADGTFDEAAARELDRVLAPREDAEAQPVNRRVLQLIVKAANHFHGDAITVLSSFRESARKGSRHRTGEALDFVLEGTKPASLAAHLRAYARVGVGVYTHRRTQFVHLDVREQSYHWLDASPPGRVWREMPLPDRSAAARDAAYAPEQDLP